MKKNAMNNFKKLENKDLKTIQGGVKHYVVVDGQLIIVDIP